MIRIKFEFLHFNFYLKKIIKLQMELDITTGVYEEYPEKKYHQGRYPHLPWEPVNREAGLSKVQKRLTVALPPPAVLDK